MRFGSPASATGGPVAVHSVASSSIAAHVVVAFHTAAVAVAVAAAANKPVLQAQIAQQPRRVARRARRCVGAAAAR
jgi:hypothetical protein